MKNENVTKFKVPFKATNGKTYLVDPDDPRVNNTLPSSKDDTEIESKKSVKVRKKMKRIECPVCEKLVAKNYIKRHIKKYHPDYDTH